MSRKKISLIGAGNIGGTLAHLIGLKDFSSFSKAKTQTFTNNCNVSFAKWVLKDKELTIKEICSLLPSINEQQLINVIQFLFDNDKIGKFGNKYQWKGI